MIRACSRMAARKRRQDCRNEGGAPVMAVTERTAAIAAQPPRRAAVGRQRRFVIGQTTCAGLMQLWEEDFFRRTGRRSPVPHASLECAARAVGILSGMIVLQFAQDRDRLKLRRVCEHRDDFSVPYVGEWVGAGAPVAARLLGRHCGVPFNAPGAAYADAGLGGGDLLRVMFAFGHVEANLLVGNADSRHVADRFLIRSAIVEPGRLGVAGDASSSAATPPSTPHHRPKPSPQHGRPT